MDEIATSRLKNCSPCDKDVQTRAINAITIDNIHIKSFPTEIFAFGLS